MKKVLVYTSGLLPYSETFIKEQVLSFQRWHPVLAGLHRVPGLVLDGIDLLLLRPLSGNIFFKICSRIFREIALDYPGDAAKLKQQKAALLHVHFGTEAVAVWPVAKKIGVPIVITLHGFDINVYREWWESGKGGFSNVRYPRRLLELAQQPAVHFVAVSNAIRQRAIAYGIPAGRITVCYIGIDLKKFAPAGKPLAERALRVLYVGRMVEKKGGAILIEAFARIRKDIPAAELVMIGDGPLLDSYKKQAHQLSVPVRFLGARTPAEVKANLDTCRIFCLPSIIARNGDAEGLPMVVLEAQACGVPVVTSALGGVGEGLLDGETGFSFAEHDVDALVRHLSTLLQDHALATAMSIAAPVFIAKNFDIMECTKKLENFYEDIIVNTSSER
ncbi:MAG: glycosyltransferase [Massilia sp.]|nr:glycosyltransferase [Massilia sp.]